MTLLFLEAFRLSIKESSEWLNLSSVSLQRSDWGKRLYLRVMGSSTAITAPYQLTIVINNKNELKGVRLSLLGD